MQLVRTAWHPQAPTPQTSTVSAPDLAAAALASCVCTRATRGSLRFASNLHPNSRCADTGSGHGSHTAGIVGAVGDNGVGVAGGSWNVALWICRAETPNVGITLSSALACYTLCGNQAGVRVVSASYGGPYETTLERDAIAALGAKGILFVAAAGNTGSDVGLPGNAVFPAAFPLDNIISGGCNVCVGVGGCVGQKVQQSPCSRGPLGSSHPTRPPPCRLLQSRRSPRPTRCPAPQAIAAPRCTWLPQASTF